MFSLVKSKVSDQVVIVLFICYEKELEFLIANRVRLFNARFILILTNGGESLTSKALLLYPRYLAYTGYGFKDVAAVLDKMINGNGNG
ncbi:MAG: hypothetical protein U9N77_07265, partial [Thermodesulfobacteriota bacterium]|nr:hypothetical protein [Thermodesulfobacteriota bacterium]